jgi:hypothetical protein
MGTTFVLLVTMIFSNQPASNYQTTFHSRAACETARNALIAERDRVQAEAKNRAAQQFGGPGATVSAGPQIIAVCVEQ